MNKTRQTTLLIAAVMFQFAVSHSAISAETGEAAPERQKTNAQWKAELTPQQYKIMRQKGTERAFSGHLLHNKRDGFYHCAACDAALFNSKSKFDSGTGWPSFDAPASTQQVELRADWSHGIKRTEVICKKCGGHLGHLFKDGPTATGERFCINSAALQFETGEKHAQ